MITDAHMKLIDKIGEMTNDLDMSTYLAVIGTAMKMYSVKHDIDMAELVLFFTKGLLEAEISCKE